MTIEGRISVDALFHDRDGTAAVSVLSLTQSDQYSSGKVAIFSGTVDTNGLTLPVSPSTYRDASGQLVSFVVINKAVAKCESGELSFVRWDSGINYQLETVLVEGDISVMDLFNIDATSEYLPTIAARSEVAAYTIIIYGS